MAGPVEKFVEGWDFIQTLGEGAYGEVKLAVSSDTQEAVAVKIMDMTKNKEAEENIRKEVLVHRLLDHENIIKFYGYRKDPPFQYLFLEYACGGELYDRIEPDVGMPEQDANRYFVQLINGVEYLHSVGVTHRDLKPENILLDDFDNLRITDFGLATVFRHLGKERKLEKVCGTVPYVAPEVLAHKPYQAQPADLWSCGIILVALLTGELPWDEPSYSCHQYTVWKDVKITLVPWNKMDSLALSLLRKLLIENVAIRRTIDNIKVQPWFTKNFSKTKFLNGASGSSTDSPTGSGAMKRMCSGMSLSPTSPSATDTDSDLGRVSCSQPDMLSTTGKSHGDGPATGSGEDLGPVHSFSQPLHPDHMLLASQYQGTPGSSQTPLQKFVRRMTRFFVKTDKDETLKELDRVLETLGYTHKRSCPGVTTVSTRDRRRMPLVFKACLMEMGENLLLDFRLSKGDGLEFKRRFIRIKEKMKPVSSRVNPVYPLVPSQTPTTS